MASSTTTAGPGSAAAETNPYADLGAIPITEPESGMGTSPPEAKANPYADLGAEEIIPDIPDSVVDPSTSEGVADETRNWVTSNVITREDVERIAGKHKGVDPDVLWEATGLLGGVREDLGPDDLAGVAQTAVGKFGRIFFGLPGKVARMASGEKYEPALDELNTLIGQRSSWFSLGAEGLALPVGVAVKAVDRSAKAAKAAGTAPKLAETVRSGIRIGGGTGAAQGLGESEAGREVRDTAVAGLLGAGLGGMIPFVGGKIAGKIRNRLTSDVLDAVDDTIVEAGERSYRRAAAAESALEDLALEPEVLARLSTTGGMGGVPGATREVRDSVLIQVLGPRGGRELRQAARRELSPFERSFLTQTGGWSDYVFRKYLSDSVRDFATHLAGRTVGGIRESAEMVTRRMREDPGGTTRNWQRFRRTEHMMRSGAPERIGKIIDSVGGDAGRWNRIRNFFVDARYVYSAIDDRFGTELVPVLDRITGRYHQYQVQLLRHGRKQQQLVRATTRSGLSGEEVTRALDSGGKLPEEATDAQRRVISDWQKHFEDLRRSANEATDADGKWIGLRISRLGGEDAGYVPHQVVRPREVVTRMRNRREALAEEVGVDPVRLGLGEVRNLAAGGSREAREYLSALELLSGGDRITSAEDFLRAARLAEDPGGSGRRVLTQANAALAREGGIPPFLRERDVGKLALRWTQNTFRHIYLRDGIDELRQSARALRLAGGGKESLASDYVLRHVADLAGTSREVPANWFERSTLRFLSQIDRRAEEARRAGNPVRARVWEASAAVPNLLAFGTQQMYPFFLGMRPDAVLRNLTQPFFLSGTELGGAYGQALALRGQISAMRDYATSAGRERFRRLREIGMLPPKQTLEMSEALEQGIRRGGVRGVGRKGLDLLNDAAMSMYVGADLHNRMVTYHMAERWSAGILSAAKKSASGKALSRSERSALSALRESDSGFRQDVLRTMRDGGDPTGDIARYLINRTQFSYTRVAMSEYGRTMGPIFSMFSKWPTSILGDMSDNWMRRGAVRGTINRKALQRYWGPLAAAVVMENLMLPDVQEDEARQLLARNLVNWTPASSVFGWINGDFGKPPIMDVSGKVVQSAVDWDRAAGNMERAALALTPGGVWYRFWEDVIESERQ